jgi:hypothetical protein
MIWDGFGANQQILGHEADWFLKSFWMDVAVENVAGFMLTI